MSNAQKLVDLSGLSNPLLKKETILQIRKKGIKRPIKKLVELLNHPCSQEQVEKINGEFERKYRQAGDSEGLVKPFARDEILESMANNAASIIADGFDVAFKDNLNINSVTGQITVKRDASGNPDSRFLKCAAAEVPAEVPSESDPYKGSQQGLGRTRKHKKRSKKTLRRRKVRGNMH